MRTILGIVGAFLVGLAATPTLAQDHWVASWGAGSAQIAGEAIPAPGLTYRNIVHLSLGGKQVRLTFSNRLGRDPVTIGGVSAAQSLGRGRVNSATQAAVTFGGKRSTTVKPGQAVVSDPVSIELQPLSDLAVSIFLPEQTISIYTGHGVTHQVNYRAPGDQLTAAALSGGADFTPWLILSAVDVMAPEKGAAIVAFGDSITDGTGTTTNTNRRWPNQLAIRLQADPSFTHLAVVDEGIGGNRILHPGGGPKARGGRHPSGLSRWDADALSRAGVKYIILLEGVNDIGHSSLIRDGSLKVQQAQAPEDPITADDLIKAMTQMIDKARARGVKVIGATLTPFGGANYYREDGQEIHDKVNAFIRSSGKFDAVIDFEKATQDPDKPQYFLATYNDRDHLHPNDAGAKAMADAIDLDAFGPR